MAVSSTAFYWRHLRLKHPHRLDLDPERHPLLHILKHDECRERPGGQWPGAMWNVHGMSVDQNGNFYVAEVNNGRPQKFRPRAGASKALLVGQPIRSAWR